MGRIEDALRRAVRRPGAADADDAVDPRHEPEWLADPFDSPWQFEPSAGSTEPNPETDDAPAAPSPAVRRAEADVPRRSAAADRPLPSRRQPPRPVETPVSAAPGSLRPEPLRQSAKASVRLESQLAMRWPRPFADEVAERLVLMRATDRAAVEEYRKLSSAVRAAQPAGAGSILIVTSAAPGEGKTLTAVNLALTLSEFCGERVLLIDADVRRGHIHRLFQVTAGAGLADCLQSDVSLPVTELTENLALLQRGTPAITADALDTDRMRGLLAEVSRGFDRVIVDAPPAADAAALARMAGKVVLVVDAGTAEKAVAGAMDAIGRDRLLGIVRNRVR